MPAITAPTTTDRLWTAAQFVALAATVALIAGFFLAPDLSLKLLWSLAIPLVPASLLVAPQIWRNVCPLATLNMLSNRAGGGRTLQNGTLAVTGAVGILLLLVLVPARHVLFNTDGVALGITVIAVALVALFSGGPFDAKAGFCNSICPILPVERLYGQSPLLQIGNPRCRPCTFCTAKGCIDLNPNKSAVITTGPNKTTTYWLRTVYGAFAAAFPGFVIGYYTTVDGALDTAGTVYGTIALWMLGSYVVAAGLVLAFQISSTKGLRILAATAAALYYWLAAPGLAEAWSLPDAVIWTIRVPAILLVASWTWIAFTRTNGAHRKLA